MLAVAVTVPGYAFSIHPLETGVKVEAGDGNECLLTVAERDQPADRGFLAMTLDRKTCRCSDARSHWVRPAPVADLVLPQLLPIPQTI